MDKSKFSKLNVANDKELRRARRAIDKALYRASNKLDDTAFTWLVSNYYLQFATVLGK